MSGPGPEAATGFRIVRGRPTEADLAALTAVLLSRLAAAAHGAETAEPPLLNSLLLEFPVSPQI
ncbi:hypothetical protein DKT74_02500, partial [Streptomyces sp. ZEA17I]|uniref:acyl-CoA carboxylase subunit epsilon n=1 Tax=Streptomyces sp. ZEA17I TaxID=2202516 RepID=UPI000D8C2578